MAKFNVELEIEWIDDESKLDEEIKNQIIWSLQNKLSKPILEKIHEKADQEIAQKIDQLVVDAILSRIEEFMSTPKTITNEFGHVICDSRSPEGLLQERITGAITDKCLDGNGRYRTGYEAKYSLFDYIVYQRTKESESLIVSEVRRASEETEEQIKAMVKDKVKANVADKLTDLIVENSSTLSLKGDKQENS